jgi:4-hydroxy-2-oxoheptanedioate aldolase
MTINRTNSTSVGQTVSYPHPHRAQVGTVLTLPGAVSAELIAEPFDFVWVDLEHGALGRADAQEMILGAQAAGTLAFARVGRTDAEAMIGPMLDAGADGIVLADVTKHDQVEWAARLMRYPPSGERGYGPRRSALHHRIKRVRDTAPPQLWVQIESQEGAAEGGSIASTGRVDALVIGVADLCNDLGIPIGLSDPRLHDAIRTVRDAASTRGVLFGLAGPLYPCEHMDGLLDEASIRVHSTDARLCALAVDQTAQALSRTRLEALPTPMERAGD